MSFVGHGWRSGQASDITGVPSTCSLTSVTPSTDVRGKRITLTIDGLGFEPAAIVYANYAPIATVWQTAMRMTCPSFNTTPDSGVAGVIPIGVRSLPTERLSNIINFTATSALRRDEPVAFDPDDYTVAEVIDYLDAHPGQRAAVLAAEEAGRARVTLLAHLQR